MSNQIEYNDDVIETHTSSWSNTKREKYLDYIANQRLDYEPLISSGDRVVMEAGEKTLIVHVKPGVNVPIRGKQAKVDELINKPINSTFCYENQQFKRRLEGKIDIESVFAEVEEKELDKDFMPTSTNKDLIARQENQKLTAIEIENLKSSDLSAADIIKQVTSGSSTWEGKTEFSQLKWLKKKWAKYNQDISCLQPTVFNLHKITGRPVDEVNQGDHMRDDAYAQILAMANIGHAMRCIVVDSTDAVLSGAVQRRMGDSGSTLYLHIGRNSQQGILDLNLTQNERQRVISAPFDALPSYGWAGNQHGWNEHQQEQINKHKDLLKAKLPMPTELVLPCMTPQAQNFLQHKALAAIICHWTYDPLSLLLPLLPHLLPSSPIVLWSPTIEPLVHAMNFLQINQLATQLHLQDTWYRPLQVLPNRTHPHMNMEATGGFLLYGYTLDYTIPTLPTTLNDDTTGKTITRPNSLLHPSYQSTNNAYNYTPLMQPNRFKDKAELNQKSIDSNPNAGKSGRAERQAQHKRKWQPQQKSEGDNNNNNNNNEQTMKE